MNTRNIVIVSAVRTAVGRLGGALKDVPAQGLAQVVLAAAVQRAGIDPARVDEVILGQTKQSADAANIARVSALMAGFPVEVPGYTVHRQCGSGMQSIHDACRLIALGGADIVVAGGVESMSTAPYYLRNARFGYRSGNGELLDPNTESQPGSQPREVWGDLTMGATAENLAERYHITREEQDEFALRSQEKAWAAIEEWRFGDEIVPITVSREKVKPLLFQVDEHPRRTSLQELAQLKPAFKRNGTVTVGNASGRNDGASALVIMSEDRAYELGVRPLVRIRGLGVGAVSPEIMGLGPVPASQRALKSAGLTIEQMDLLEINEAFAAQTLAVLREMAVPRERLNVNGGAIALGHPIGNSGARITVTLVHEMLKREVRYGLATLCIAGGQGIATVFERCDP